MSTVRAPGSVAPSASSMASIPHPRGPQRAVTLPFAISKETSSNEVNAPRRKVNLRTRTSGVADSWLSHAARRARTPRPLRAAHEECGGSHVLFTPLAAFRGAALSASKRSAASTTPRDSALLFSTSMAFAFRHSSSADATMFAHARQSLVGCSLYLSKMKGIKKPAEIGWRVFKMVRAKGLEPSWGCPHTDLNRTRLPIPPRPHICLRY